MIINRVLLTLALGFALASCSNEPQLNTVTGQISDSAGTTVQTTTQQVAMTTVKCFSGGHVVYQRSFPKSRLHSSEGMIYHVGGGSSGITHRFIGNCITIPKE